ncbi:MAG: hypothetical protein R3D63_16435 [Paracoccaceae bacterium]
MLSLLRRFLGLGPTPGPASTPPGAAPPGLDLRGDPLPPPSPADLAAFTAFQAAPDQGDRRDAAFAATRARIDRLLAPAGFVRRGEVWSLSTEFGQAQVALRRLRGGTEAEISLAFLPREGHRPRNRPAETAPLSLPHFYRASEGRQFHDGRIFYAIVDHDPSALDRPMAVLRDRALPWLMGHADGHFPDWHMFLSRETG